MRKREYYWSLHHAPRKKRFDDLRTDQTEAIFSVLTQDDLEDWQLWREGFTGWKPLDEFPVLLEHLRGAPQKAVEPPDPPKGSLKALDQEMERTIALELDDKSSAPSRGGHARYEGSFIVKIKVGDRVYSSKIVNVSMNGIQLEEPLPKKLPKYFPVGLYLNKEMIPLLCSVVSSTVGPAARLRIESDEYEDMLRTWLIQFGKREE